MIRRVFVPAVIAIAAAFFLAGCGAMNPLSKANADRVQVIQNKLNRAEKMDAKECAPKEYAQARAALAYARHEAMEWHEARSVASYFDEADAAASAALAKTEPCWRAKQAPPPPPDSDRDGVPDDLDKCPNTPAGVSVDSNGCPTDADRDGVPDYLDKCPDTPAGVSVDPSGCPTDTDGDGVPDYLDKCPTTPAGLKVDAHGCSTEKLHIRINIEFDTGKAVIKPKFHDELAKVGDFMKKYPQTHITIEGHTDNVGGEAYNMKLSQQRADAVKAYLQDEFGISADRIAAKGFGDTKPIADNATPEGRAQNRRIEAVVDEVTIKR